MKFPSLVGLFLILLMTTPARSDHFYGIEPAQFDPPIDVISGVLLGNGSVSGILAESAPQPNEGFDHVVFYANAGDSITVDTIGSDQDPGLGILLDTDLDGIFVGDAPPAAGSELTFLAGNDDFFGLDSMIAFVAPYSGQYLASVAEIIGREMHWTLNVSGSTYVVPEPSTLLLVLMFAPLLTARRRAA